MTVDMIKSEERLKQFCSWAKCEAPECLVAEDGSPSSELLEFCATQNCSLDWIFCGDLSALVRCVASEGTTKISGSTDALTRQGVQDTAIQIQSILAAAIALEGQHLAEERYCQIEIAHKLAKNLNQAADAVNCV